MSTSIEQLEKTLKQAENNGHNNVANAIRIQIAILKQPDVKPQNRILKFFGFKPRKK